MILHENFSLKDILWYKIGGIARYLIDVENSEDVEKAAEFIKRNKLTRAFFIGQGSNLIFTDDFFDGAVVRFIAPKKSSIRLVGNSTVEAFAGELLDNVIKFSFENSLIGLEWAGGLPGTVGAAIRGNVGAFGGEIKDNVKEVTLLEITDKKMKLITLKRFELKFGYRNSLVKKHRNLIVVSSLFRLTPTDAAGVQRARQTYLSNIEYRNRRHPLEFPNCGSVFKNITDPEKIKSVLEIFPDLEEKIKRDWHGKVAMGYLIKRLDLAEFRVGNAQISPKHCNFIVNLGGAKAEDVLSIIKTIQEKFQETFEFTPEV
ncbi:MAG: UDP-N-acetylenolpyruvoylglucosamine reductase, partial [Candidatus Levybacteria bacterium CG10_big_fil_rev_8_21_14_0_10_36_30]